MDKEQLKQIKYIKSEIAVIENQINNIEPSTITDKVTGSSSYFPYTQRSFTLEGIDIEEYDKRTRRLRRKLINRKEKLLELQEKVNNFIDSIDDSLVRQIITLRYIEGLNWYEVADRIGENSTSESVRKVAERYLNNY